MGANSKGIATKHSVSLKVSSTTKIANPGQAATHTPQPVHLLQSTSGISFIDSNCRIAPKLATIMAWVARNLLKAFNYNKRPFFLSGISAAFCFQFALLTEHRWSKEYRFFTRSPSFPIALSKQPTLPQLVYWSGPLSIAPIPLKTLCVFVKIRLQKPCQGCWQLPTLQAALLPWQ